MKKEKIKVKAWGVAQIWNETFEAQQYPPKKRDYISAGDIGKSFLDRYYKMQGIEPTNPFDYRTLRVFSAGNEFHHLIHKIFEKIGLVINAEQYVEIPATDKTLKVLGYYDLKLGGKVNLKKAINMIKAQEFSEFVEKKAIELAKYFKKKYPNGFTPIICENKSINSNAFWARKNYIGFGYIHHQMQLYTYLKATDIKRGVLLYISKDDLMIEECPMYNPTERLEKIWIKDIEQMTYYIKNNIIPPKEDDIIWDEKKKKWIINWKVSWSSYFTKITGFKDSKEWEKSLRPKVNKLNKEYRDKYKKDSKKIKVGKK